MSILNINKMTISSVLYLYTDRDTFFLTPEYQRQSDIWNLEKRQLLVDSIINGYDIPKLYFHKYPKPKVIKGKQYTHAIIDGKQRLESIWGYISGDFPLSGDAEYVRDTSRKIAGLTYKELGQQHPDLKIKLDSFPLDIIVIETDDLELIEDMFSRLNEAVPLSAAEKRNALGGPIPVLIRKLCKHDFFAKRIPFGNSRYRHYDIAAKCYLVMDRNKVVDTKKVHLDDFVRTWKKNMSADSKQLDLKTRGILDALSKIFVRNDTLLRSVGMVVLYFHTFRIANEEGWIGKISRNDLIKFERLREQNREKAEKDLANADYDLIEFDKFVQTPNDSYATEFRLKVLFKKAFGRSFQIQNNQGAQP